MRIFLICLFILSFQAKATGFTDADLKQNIGRVLEHARAIVKKAQAQGNPYAAKLLTMLVSSRLTFTSEENVLAEYIEKERMIYLYRVPAKYIVFDRDFMLDQYYPAILIHEAVHDLVRVSSKNIEKLHGKEFARICASIIKSAKVDFVMRDGWSKGFDFSTSRYLDFQMNLVRKNLAYEVLKGKSDLSEIRLRKGVVFSFLGHSFIAGNNVVLHVQGLLHLEFDQTTNSVRFDGEIKNVMPHFDGLPLDVLMKAGSTITLLSNVILKANRDSLIRAFNYDQDGHVTGLNLITNFPGLIDASFSLQHPSFTLQDVAGVYLNPLNSEIYMVTLENTEKFNSIPLPSGTLSLGMVQGTVTVSSERLRCSEQKALGDFEEDKCLFKTNNGKSHQVINSMNVRDLF